MTEPDIQLAEGYEPEEPNEETNRKSHFPSESPRHPASYTRNECDPSHKAYK